MRLLLAGVLISLGLVGCAAIHGAVDREKIGLSQPMNDAGEKPAEVAKRQAEPIKSFPYGGLAYPVVAGLLTLIYGWTNGGRIQKKKPETVTPYTGEIGKNVPLVEGTVQNAATLVQGVLNPPVTTSPAIERFWKVAIGILGTFLIGMMSSPDLKEFLTDHKTLTAIIGLMIPTLLALEKKLQEVLPTAPPQ